MKTRSVIAFLFVAVLVLCQAIPTFALGQVVSKNDDYIVEETATLGWTDLAVEVNADGSFSIPLEGGEEQTAVFGTRAPLAEISFEEEPYPLSTHVYSVDGLEYTLRQFVVRLDTGAYIYSRLKVKNTTDVSMSFPAVSLAEAITRVPGEIASKKSETVDYRTLIAADIPEGAANSIVAETASETESYDSAKQIMLEHWNGVLDSAVQLSGLASRHDSAIVGYRKSIVEKAMGISASSASGVLTYADEAEAVLSEGRDLYLCALALLKTGRTDLAMAALPAMRTAASAVSAEAKGSLEATLDSHLSLQGYAYILNTLAAEDDSLEEEARKAAQTAEKLSLDIAKALGSLDAGYTVDWETVTVDEGDGLLVNGNGYASATALCEWYIKSASFTGGVSSELVALAKDAIAYYNAYASPEAAILSLITERADGTVIIGRGAPLSLLRNKKTVKIENYVLSSGTEVTLSVKLTKTDVDITLTGAVNAPVQIEFPAFVSNMEYASVGFDNESGIVTAPVGISTVNIKLLETPGSLEEERSASVAFEEAVAAAVAKDVENPTTVSSEAFESALARAQKSRTATADEQVKAADKLIAATAGLSPMVAGYSHSIPAEGELVGTLTKSEIYQKFTLPSDGRVKSLFVGGEYTEGISAAVYTLRGDNYTTDELRSETYGQAAEGGIVFDLDFDAVKDTTYVLCIFSEEGDVTLNLKSSYDSVAHTFEMGEPTVYTAASLDLEFSVEQGDRSALDSFYSACMDADLSEYTKESQKVLKSTLKKAKTILCSSLATKEECKKAYDEMKDAYNGLRTYASEDKIEDTPVVGLVLIGVVVLLLAATLISAVVARRKMDPNQ